MRRGGHDRYTPRGARVDAKPFRCMQDLPYQPNAYLDSRAPIDEPIACRHGVPWLDCERCSTRRNKP